MVCAVAAVLIFLLPLAVPVPFLPAISASYLSGFNNRVAAIAAAACGLGVFLWRWKFSRPAVSPRDAEDVVGPVGWPLTGATILVTCTFFAAAWWMLSRSHLRYLADAGYFIEQMSSHAEYGRQLYSGLEFAYGPLLFYPGVVLQRWLHCGWLAAYFTTLAMEQSLGLLELVFLLNRLPIRSTHRRLGLVLLAVGALNPLLGLNYTLFRFLTPFFLLVLASQVRNLLVSTTLLTIGEAACLGLSAEMGVAFAAGVLVFGLLQASRHGFRWLWSWAAILLGAAAFSALVGPAYLQMLHSFSKGALNLPVAPYPHLLIYLFAIVWLVPYSLGSALRLKSPHAIPLVSCFAVAIGLIPVALGRCDPLHVFFNGAGLLVLSLAAIRSQSRGARTTWIAALALLVFWQLAVTNKLFRYRTADTLSVTVMPRLPQALQDAALTIVGSDSDLANHLQAASLDQEYRLDVPRLERKVGNALVATPLEITPIVEDALKRSHHYRADYFAFTVDLFSAPNEARKIEDLNQAQWALVPTIHGTPFIELPNNLGDLQGFNFPYRARHRVPFQAGRALTIDLKQEWERVDSIGPYTLLRRRSGASAVTAR